MKIIEPKERAKEFIERFLLHVHQGGESHHSLEEREFLNARDCAIISVEYLTSETGSKYWYEVKKEISNFKFEEFNS